jgi:hypothetical protein
MNIITIATVFDVRSALGRHVNDEVEVWNDLFVRQVEPAGFGASVVMPVSRSSPLRA